MSENTTVVGSGTKITLGVLITGITLITTTGGVAIKSFYDLRAEIQADRLTAAAKQDKTDERLGALEGRLKGFNMETLSECAMRMAMQNPGMTVPDPRDPSKSFLIPKVSGRD